MEAARDHSIEVLVCFYLAHSKPAARIEGNGCLHLGYADDFAEVAKLEIRFRHEIGINRIHQCALALDGEFEVGGKILFCQVRGDLLQLLFAPFRKGAIFDDAFFYSSQNGNSDQTGDHGWFRTQGRVDSEPVLNVLERSASVAFRKIRRDAKLVELACALKRIQVRNQSGNSSFPWNRKLRFQPLALLSQLLELWLDEL